MCVCVCVCVAKPVAVELRCHATALISHVFGSYTFSCHMYGFETHLRDVFQVFAY